MHFELNIEQEKFWRALDILLASNRWKKFLVYLYDIIFCSRDAESHLKNVEKVFRAFKIKGHDQVAEVFIPHEETNRTSQYRAMIKASDTLVM